MRSIFVIFLIFLINPIWASSQNIDSNSIRIESNKGYSEFSIYNEKCAYCISNGFVRDYLVLEQIRNRETNDEFDTRLYIFVGVYYIELSLEKKECSCIVDSISCDDYFILNDKIMKFITENHFPDPIVRNMYIVRDDEIEIFRPTTEQGILFYNMIKKYYISKYF
jgi:hypothetical protein